MAAGRPALTHGTRSVVFGANVADKCGTCDTTHRNDCRRDCKGAWGGKAQRDHCGKCGGDNSTCMDCAKNVCRGPVCVDPNTQKMVMRSFEDRCGACVSGGAGRACRPDCKGVFGGKAKRDLCGVCAGDNSTCADCAGTPFGEAYADACGTCDANEVNDCTQDCAGQSSIPVSMFVRALQSVNETFCVLHRRRGLTLPRPIAAPAATSSPDFKHSTFFGRSLGWQRRGGQVRRVQGRVHAPYASMPTLTIVGARPCLMRAHGAAGTNKCVDCAGTVHKARGAARAKTDKCGVCDTNRINDCRMARHTSPRPHAWSPIDCRLACARHCRNPAAHTA